jgi:hypothetical protein
MRKSNRLILEYCQLAKALYGVDPSVCVNKANDIELSAKGRWYGTIDARHFEHFWIRPLRIEADKTHLWYKPGKIDECCRVCGQIRRDDRANGICLCNTSFTHT